MGSLSPQAFTIISINFPQSLKSNPKVSFYNYLYSFRSRRKKYFINSVKNAAFFDLCFEFKSIHERSTRVSLFFDVSMSRVQCRRWDQISPRIRVACIWPNANVVHLLIPSYPPPSFLLSFVFPTAYRVQTTALLLWLMGKEEAALLLAAHQPLHNVSTRPSLISSLCPTSKLTNSSGSDSSDNNLGGQVIMSN